MDLHEPGLTIAVALAAGAIAQAIARHLRLPGIVLLLAAGLLLGPEGAGIVHPRGLGDGLNTIVGLAVAVILFEGGLNLNIRRLRQQASVIRRLVTIGAAITAIGGTLAARLIMGWGWPLAILFGCLITVTGPTVINPIMRRIRLKRRLRTILEAEGVLIDPIGAILAVVALEVIIEMTDTGSMAAAGSLLGFPYRLGLGVLVGVVGGLIIGALLRRRRVIPEGLENIVTLALVLALYEISDAILAESGIMSVAIAGIVVGNLGIAVQRELLEFKEQLTILLVGMLFVLLAADVELAALLALGWPGLATVGVLILVVRPLDIAACTQESSLTRNERLFLAWLAPRGIVAFAVSSLFAQELVEAGYEHGAQLGALVFLVIAVTVVVQGGTAGWIASILSVRRDSDSGHVIVGANALGRALGNALRDGFADSDEEIVLVDSNAYETRVAEEDGFRVVYGNAQEERTMLRADVEMRRSFVTATPNEGVNLLLARKALEEFRVGSASVALQERDSGVSAAQVHEAHAEILFGRPIDLENWIHHFAHGNTVVARWRYEGEGQVSFSRESGESGAEREPTLPMVRVRGAVASPITDQFKIRPGDEVYFAWFRATDEVARAWLAGGSWTVVEPAANDDEPGDAAPEGAG